MVCLGSIPASAQEPVPTTTQLQSSLNPASDGDAVDFTAMVDAGGVAVSGGSVYFYDGNQLLGNAPLIVGSATFPAGALPVGVHFIQAVFPGDTTHSGSSSEFLAQLVNPIGATGSNIAIDNIAINPMMPNQPSDTIHMLQTVTFTATVTSGSPDFTGSVIFIDNSLPMGNPVALPGTGSAQQAMLNTPNLLIGQHNIAAVYTGDANFAASVSPDVSVLRTPRPR